MCVVHACEYHLVTSLQHLQLQQVQQLQQVVESSQRGRRELSNVKYICDFHKFQTVWCNSIGFALPRGGGRTHGRTDGGIISFELSPLAGCMRINSNKGSPRVTESGIRARGREEREECGIGRTE